jgi:hypothetical protein
MENVRSRVGGELDMGQADFRSTEHLSDEPIDYPSSHQLITTRNIPYSHIVHVTCKVFSRLFTITGVNIMNRRVSEDLDQGRSCP